MQQHVFNIQARGKKCVRKNKQTKTKKQSKTPHNKILKKILLTAPL